MDTVTSRREATPEKLPIGTVIQGMVTLEGKQHTVEITIGIDAPDISPEEHLILVQGMCNNETNLDAANPSNEVTVSKVSLPEKIEPWKISQRTHFRVIAEVPTDRPSSEGIPTQETETRKGIKKILSWIGL